MATTTEPIKLIHRLQPPKQHKQRGALLFGTDQHGRQATFLVCNKCQGAEGAVIPMDAPPLAIDQHFAERRGWQVEGHGRKATCPKCQQKKPVAVEITPAQTRLIFKALEEHLRVEGKWGEYEPGWSDARIAEAADVPEPNVREARRSGFAPHLVDRAREELLSEVRELEVAASRELKELADLVQETLRTVTASFAELRSKLQGPP